MDMVQNKIIYLYKGLSIVSTTPWLSFLPTQEWQSEAMWFKESLCIIFFYPFVGGVGTPSLSPYGKSSMKLRWEVRRSSSQTNNLHVGGSKSGSTSSTGYKISPLAKVALPVMKAGTPRQMVTTSRWTWPQIIAWMCGYRSMTSPNASPLRHMRVSG